jgi:hypothetical protein
MEHEVDMLVYAVQKLDDDGYQAVTQLLFGQPDFDDCASHDDLFMAIDSLDDEGFAELQKLLLGQ